MTDLDALKAAHDKFWDRRTTSYWNQRYDYLVAYLEGGRTMDALRKSKKHRKLWNWVQSQRRNFHRGTVPPQAVEKLAELGVGFGNSTMKHIRDRLRGIHDELLDYAAEHGDLLVPQRYPDNPALGRAVDKLRYTKRNDPDNWRVVWTEKAFPDFEWNPGNAFHDQDKIEEFWRYNFSALAVYYADHGHADVPVDVYPLGRWLARQRRNWRAGKLRADRVTMLEVLQVQKTRPAGGAGRQRGRKKPEDSGVKLIRQRGPRKNDEKHPET